jgi:ribulose-bisphosphate carboxylase large chain
MLAPDSVLQALWHDLDARADLVRSHVYERLAAQGPVASPDHIVATYVVASRAHPVETVGGEISYHMTSSVRNPAPGTLLAECTGEVLAADPWDSTGRCGLVWVGFPVKMMQQADGKVYSTDLLHLAAGEGAFGLTDHSDLQLARLEFPEAVLATFPGPAYGAAGVRETTRFPVGRPMFGTILKPTSGITPTQVGGLVRELAGNPLFGFGKEDENLNPGAPFCPLADRAREAVAALRGRAAERGGLGLLFAPHITAPPDRLMRYLDLALDAGVNAVMFSDQFVGGTTRMVREATMHLDRPPAIYAHNGGISTRTRAVWREVLDLLVRLDGADFRQTAPVTTGASLLRPYGREWLECEAALTRPLGHIKPTMIARAGGLDQGNIILNLRDAAARGYGDGVLYLAGSAINSIKDSSGKSSPELGSAAMAEALEAFQTGLVTGEEPQRHLAELYGYARSHAKKALQTALEQRYPEVGTPS